MKITKSGKLVSINKRKDIKDDVCIIPDGVISIGNGVFQYCKSLKKVIISNSVTSIGDCAFCNCVNLTEINIPNNITSIGYGAFWVCKSLKKVNISNSVISIGNGAFCDCENLIEINIPCSVKSIGCYAFGGCKNLKLNKKIKATNADLTCLGYQFKLNEWSEKINDIKLCEKGYHFVENPFEVFNFYSEKIGKNVRFFEVETEDVSEERDKNSSKRVCKRIKLVREITSYKELLM